MRLTRLTHRVFAEVPLLYHFFSEFGIYTTDAEAGTIGYPKAQVQKHLKAISLPYALFFTGAFAEYAGWFIAMQDGNVKITGDGNTLCSFTAMANIVDFVVNAVTSEPTHWDSLRVFAR